MMKKLFLILSLLLLVGCSREEISPPTSLPPETAVVTEATEPAPPPTTSPPDPVQEILNTLSIEERVGQLFLARCIEETALEDIGQYALGGFVLFSADFEGQTPESMAEKISSYQAAARLPMLIAVDEEGGTVNRVSRYTAFRSQPFSSIRSLYDGGGLDWVLAETEEKSILLRSLGINVNLGPVCDITTDPSAFLYRRSLGQDGETTAYVISAMVKTMNAHSLGSALKHFPGYGDNADTHVGIAQDSRPLAELEGSDLIPFAAGMDAGAGAVMVSHTIVECLDETLPASLSPSVVSYLRETMGFDGVVLTDDLVMEAITDAYGVGESAVMAVNAGADLLCSTDYALQYEAVLHAVLDGTIDFDTLNAAAYRVLKWKYDLGLLG